jgi:hypothetical protein
MSSTPSDREAPISDAPDMVVPEDELAEQELAERRLPDGASTEDAPDEEDLAEQIVESEPKQKVSMEGVEVAVADVDPGGDGEVPPADDTGAFMPIAHDETDPSHGSRQ